MKRKQQIRTAFTLVELLVVITIIGILASLITVGVRGAVITAKKAKINMELSQVTVALDRYRSEFGEYPPDLSDKAAVLRHVKKRWPRFQLTGSDETEQIKAFFNAVSYAYRNAERVAVINTLSNGELSVTPTMNFFDTTHIDPTDTSATLYGEASYIAALPLWLGGFPNQDGTFSGFSADPTAPFGRCNGVAVDGRKIDQADWNNIMIGTQDSKTVFMELTVGKNVRFVITGTGNNTVFPCVANVLRNDLFVPYIYFRARPGGGQNAYLGVDENGDTIVRSLDFANGYNGTWSEMGEAAPYAKAGDPFNKGLSPRETAVWHNPDSFQLIHPGLDGKFGVIQTRIDDDPFCDENFRSILSDATNNNIGQADYDNLTNFTEGKDLKTLIE